MVQEKTLKRRSKSLQAINAGEDVEKMELFYIVGGNANNRATMEKSVEILKKKTENISAIIPSNPTAGHTH